MIRSERNVSAITNFDFIEFDNDGTPTEQKGIQVTVHRGNLTKETRVEFLVHLTDGQILEGEIRIRT